jgi:gas vesicle protein
MERRTSMTNGNGNFKYLAWLATGSVVGAGLALLFAPQSGKQTRRDIRYLGKTVRNRSEKALLEAGRQKDRLVRDISKKLGQQIDRGQQLTDGVRSALETGRGYLRRMKSA